MNGRGRSSADWEGHRSFSTARRSLERRASRLPRRATYRLLEPGRLGLVKLLAADMLVACSLPTSDSRWRVRVGRWVQARQGKLTVLRIYGWTAGARRPGGRNDQRPAPREMPKRVGALSFPSNSGKSTQPGPGNKAREANAGRPLTSRLVSFTASSVHIILRLPNKG